jgi:putative nucleotidyltransferase with HDIG domain
MRKHKILFVDDDILILKGLNRSIEEYSDYWDSDFANSGREALEKLNVGDFDAVVTDLLMPGMNGLVLLEQASNLFPGVLRFVLSGNTSDVNSINSASFVHQMFPKPCDMALIFEGVEKSCRLRDSLADPRLIRIITKITTLPSKPDLYEQLLSELQNPESSIKAIGDIVAKDAAMTAKVLQLVNSAFFGLAVKISNPHRAISIIGLNTTKALVLSSQVFSEFENRGDVPFAINRLWTHSLLVSSIARKMAEDLNLSPGEQEDAQVAGILHDIGILLEIKIQGFFNRVRFQPGLDYVYTEYEILGTSHAEMGAYLLGIWGLPNQIIDAVMYHHFPDKQIAGKCNILMASYLANGLLNYCQNRKEKEIEKFVNVNYVKQFIDIEWIEKWVGYIKEVLAAEEK